MLKHMLIGVVLMLSTGISASAVNIVSNGKPVSTIVLGKDSIPAEKTAATELQSFIKQISGAEIPIIETAKKDPKRCRIFIGQTSAVKRLMPGTKWDSLKFDGILIKSVGNDLIISGDRPRGTLYAVYTLLENLGVRFLAPDETTIPSKKTISLPVQNTQYIPSLRYREVTYKRVVRQNPVFCARLKLNGHHHEITPEYGGNLSIIGFVHTFDQFMPVDKYIGTHPEWMSLLGGKRVGGQGIGQLCLTNQEMKKEFIRLVLEQIKKKPEAGLISVSQNDGGRPCECDNCKAAVEKLGNQSDLLIQFVNDVAVEVEKQYPDFLVETLAYTYTRKAPETIRPRKNVLIRLCSIEGDFSKPLDSEVNKTFMEDFKAWSAITDKMFIWDYTVGFGNLHLPYPNTQVLAPNVRTFLAHKTVGLHEQGDMYNPEVSLQPLKAYLLAKLLWQPDIDPDKFTKEYLNGYYGAAGPYLYDYVKLLEKAVQDNPIYMQWCQTTTPYLTSDVLIKAFQLFDNAEKAVAGNEKLLKRVEIQKLAIEQAWFRTPIKVREIARKSLAIDDAKMLDAYIKLAEETGNVFYGEGTKFKWDDVKLSAIGDTQPISGPAPERVKNLPATDWKEIRLSRAYLSRADLASIVDDPQALTGKAVKAVGSTLEWAVQFNISPFDIKDFSKAEIIFSIKCTGRAKAGQAFSVGVYDIANQKMFPGKTYNLQEIEDDNYHEYSAGTYDLHEGMYIYLAPPGDAKLLDSVYIDRVYLVKAK